MRPSARASHSNGIVQNYYAECITGDKQINTNSQKTLEKLYYSYRDGGKSGIISPAVGSGVQIDFSYSQFLVGLWMSEKTVIDSKIVAQKYIQDGTIGSIFFRTTWDGLECAIQCALDVAAGNIVVSSVGPNVNQTALKDSYIVFCEFIQRN